MLSRSRLLVVLLLLGVSLVGCGASGGSSSDGGGSVNSQPEKIDGTPSDEFEQDDIDAANNASDAVKGYCADAVSEAQRIGCESHVTEDEIP